MKKKPQNNLLTTALAAKLLGFSTTYIRKLIRKGDIQAQKVGHDWIFTEQDIVNIKRQRFYKDT